MADEILTEDTPTRLKDFPYMINNTAIPFPTSVEDSREVKENVNESETGKDILQIRRVGKRSLAYTYRLLGDWIPTFESWADSTTALTVKIYDSTQQNGYIEKSMRMRDFRKSLVKNSADLYGIMGIWDISFTLIEI